MTNRVILHCDLNNFYASVECLEEPLYKDKVLVVCGSVQDRHGIVLAKNQKAKNLGITTGMTLNNAKALSKELVAVECDMSKYLRYSKKVRKIYENYTDLIESFGIDEAWLDVTNNTKFNSAFDIAYDIKETVKKQLGLTISVGISYNKAFAKLASDVKKPDGITLIDESNYKNVVWNTDVSDLLFIGKKIAKILNDLNIFTIGDLAKTNPLTLSSAIGKWSEQLLRFANGTDNSPVIPTDLEEPAKSVSNSVTAYRDLTSNNDVDVILHVLAETVVNRIIDLNIGLPTILSITIKDTEFNSITRQTTIEPSLIVKDVHLVAFNLFKEHYNWQNPVRLVGLALSSFTEKDKKFSTENENKVFKLEKAIKKLTDKNGKTVVSSGVSLYDRKLINQKFHDKGISE